MKSSFQDKLIDSYSDVELVKHILDSRVFDNNKSMFPLSKHFTSINHEQNDIQDAAKATEIAYLLKIRVPKIKRIVVSDRDTYSIVERVEGNTLEEIWPDLSCFSTIKLALQLRRYIQSLRSMTSTTAGSPVSGLCKSRYLKDKYGLPAMSGRENVNSFLRFWTGYRSLRQQFKSLDQSSTLPSPGEYVPPTSDTFVFTNHNLVPRNITVDLEGQLWLNYWDSAGWYPSYFEYAAMHNFMVPKSWSWLARIRWNVFTWIAAGRFERDRRALERIRSKHRRCPVGRRMEILRRGAPSRRPAYEDE